MYDAWARKFDIGGEQISLEGFYKQLHAYIRTKLSEFYNEKVVGAAYKCSVPEDNVCMIFVRISCTRGQISKRTDAFRLICWATCGHSHGSTSKTWLPPFQTLPQSISHQPWLKRYILPTFTYKVWVIFEACFVCKYRFRYARQRFKGDFLYLGKWSLFLSKSAILDHLTTLCTE